MLDLDFGITEDHPSNVYWQPMSRPGWELQHVDAQRREHASHEHARELAVHAAARTAHLEAAWATQPTEGRNRETTVSEEER